MRGILSIRKLQTEQRLPLSRIKRALEGDPVAVPAAEMVDVALSSMLAFLGLLRTRAVLEEFRARSHRAPARRRRAPAAQA